MHTLDKIAEQIRSGSRYFVRQPDGDYVFRAKQSGGGYVHAVITAESGVKQVKVTQPPEIDWELLADGIPHHIDLHKAEMEAQRMYERKGYWFMPMEKPNVYAMMTIRSKGPMDRRAAVYEKTYAYSDLKKALSEGESAIKTLIAGEHPRVRDLKRIR